MKPTLEQLIEQGERLKIEGFFYGCDDFWEWHENCLDFLEYVKLDFREKVTNPFDALKGVAWLQETFRKRDDGDANRQ